MLSSATSPAAARTPTWRIPPPSIFLARRARVTNSREPQTREPTGAARPLDRQKVIESTGRAKSATGRPSATAALKMRAPSRCTGTLWARAAAATSEISSGVQQVPPWRLCVFSRQTRPVAGMWMLLGRTLSRTWPAVRKPRSVAIGRVCSPPNTAALAPS